MNFKKNKIAKALLMVGALSAGTAQAEIVFNGFASIVGGTVSTDALKSDGNGGTIPDDFNGYEDGSFDFSQDSLLALQASSDLGNGLSVTAQILARGENDWDPSFEWAYIAYEATDNLRLLAGRQRVPFYMYSDFLDVSYAYPWITPPQDVYSLAFDTFDGLAAIYTTNFGEFDTTFHAIYGGNKNEMIISGETVESPKFENMMGMSVTVNRDWLTLRAAYFQADMDIPLQNDGLGYLSDAWSATPYSDVASEFVIEGNSGEFLELGFQIDYNNFIIVGEYTDLTVDETPIAGGESMYIMGGMRFDDMLVHVTLGATDKALDNFISHVPTGADPALDGLIAGTQGYIDDAKNEASYVTLGLRWDFHDSAALKFEYTSYSDDINSDNDAGLFRTALVTVF